MDVLLVILPAGALWLVVWLAYTLVRRGARKYLPRSVKEKYQHRLEESKSHMLPGAWLYGQYMKDAKGALSRKGRR